MDVGTIAGLVLAFGGIFASMILEGSSPMAIILIPPMLLVIFGTFGAALAGTFLKDGIAVVGNLMRAITGKTTAPDAVIETIVKLAERARREGLLALEDAAKDVDDDFLKRGLELAIDGTDPEELRDILEGQLAAKQVVDAQAAKFFADMGGYSPTIGIIGTVIGLVHVLSDLSKPNELGAKIASAFVATLWGVMLANVVWLPVGNKLKRLSAAECQRMELVIEGILAIQAGSNPRVINQKLRSFLPAEAAAKGDDKAKKAA